VTSKPDAPAGKQLLVFDASTYRYLGTRESYRKNGHHFEQLDALVSSGVVDHVGRRPAHPAPASIKVPSAERS
jgi:hypothetical protein